MEDRTPVDVDFEVEWNTSEGSSFEPWWAHSCGFLGAGFTLWEAVLQVVLKRGGVEKRTEVERSLLRSAGFDR